MRMGRLLACLLTAGVVLVAAAPSQANVFASALQQTGPNSLSFILNENADSGVTVEMWEVGGGMVYSEALGALAKGSHSWSWNSSGYTLGNNYTAKIIAADDGYGDWTEISVDSTLNNFYIPNGVSVNKDPTSQYFGRIYVSESRGATTGAGRTTTDGLYLLNADISDAVGQGDTARNGGVTWNGGTDSSSPRKVEVGPDGSVYVGDWSDSHSGLWMGDPDFNSATEVLDSTGRNAAGLNVTHGSITGIMIEGTGAARQIFTMDEDLPNTGSLWRYDIGTNSLFTGPPSAVVYDDGANGNRIVNFTNDVVRAQDGTLWISQVRAGGAPGADPLLSLMQVSADGSTVLWASVPDLASFSIDDPLRRTQGLAVDPVTGYLALGTYNAGAVIIWDPVNKQIVDTVVVPGSSNRDVAFDAVGNLYVVNNSAERLKIYSPGAGANSFTSETWFTMVPEPSSMLVLLAGLPMLIRRRKS